MVRHHPRQTSASFNGRGVSGLRLVTTLFLIIMLLLPTGAALAVDAPKLTLSPASQEKTVGEFASFTAHLVDGLGEPISGEAVQLLVNGDPVGFPVNTDSSGNAQLQYTSNAVRTDAVTATASPGGDNVTSSSVNVEWLPSRTTSISPGDLVKISLVPTSSSNATGSTQTLTAIISDQAGSRVSGILVRFLSLTMRCGPL